MIDQKPAGFTDAATEVSADGKETNASLHYTLVEEVDNDREEQIKDYMSLGLTRDQAEALS